MFREYSTNASKRKYLHSNFADGTYYITMNLTQPPFDDVHVRRAMNWVIDREAMRRAWGGAVSGVVAEHIIPHYDDRRKAGRTSTRSRLPATAGASRRRVPRWRKSKYANSNGVCTAKECKNVLLITDVRAVDKLTLPTVQAGAAKIGITFTSRTVNGAYPVIQTTSKNVPISNRPRWFKDFADASTFVGPLFDGRSIIPSGNTNYSLVGAEAGPGEAAGPQGEHSGTSPASTSWPTAAGSFRSAMRGRPATRGSTRS